MNKYYVAYGSNLNFEQMKIRCPDAKFIGKGVINDYELVFRGSYSSAVATVEPKKGQKVPAGVWSISKRDEINLDRYEGYPHLYDKKIIEINGENSSEQAIIYIMNAGHVYGVPNNHYYKTIEQGYKDCGLDGDFLDDAVNEMIDRRESHIRGIESLQGYVELK